jgi:hypothetical protein
MMFSYKKIPLFSPRSMFWVDVYLPSLERYRREAVTGEIVSGHPMQPPVDVEGLF